MSCKNFRKQSIRTSDIYVVSKILDYENYLKKLIDDKEFKYEVLKKFKLYLQYNYNNCHYLSYLI